MSEQRVSTRFYVDCGRIVDREWTLPGYVIKVWALKETGPGLTDLGPEVNAEADRLCALLNEGHEARAALHASERAAAALRAALEDAEHGISEALSALENDRLAGKYLRPTKRQSTDDASMHTELATVAMDEEKAAREALVSVRAALESSGPAAAEWERRIRDEIRRELAGHTGSAEKCPACGEEFFLPGNLNIALHSHAEWHQAFKARVRRAALEEAAQSCDERGNLWGQRGGEAAASGDAPIAEAHYKRRDEAYGCAAHLKSLAGPPAPSTSSP